MRDRGNRGRRFRKERPKRRHSGRMSMRIYIGGFPTVTTSSQIIALFTPKPVHFVMIMDRYNFFWIVLIFKD